jgi:hypothetical protein
MQNIQYYGKILLTVLVMVCAGTACSEDHFSSNDRDGKETTILLGATTRSVGGDWGDAASDDDKDAFIGDCRVLVFRARTGNLVYNFEMKDNPDALKIKTGSYHFVFIGNLSSDPVLEAILTSNAWDPEAGTGYRYLSNLDAFAFASTAFTSNKAIPMVTVIKDVTIAADGSTYPSGSQPTEVVGELIGKISSILDADYSSYSTVNNRWTVKLERLGVRVDLSLEFASNSVAQQFSGMQISRVPKQVYLLNPKSDGSAHPNSTATSADYETSNRTIAFDSSTEIIDGDGVGTGKNGIEVGKKGYLASRIILPASAFSLVDNPTDKTKGIQLVATFGSVQLSAVLGQEAPAFPTGYSAPRNYRFPVNGKVNGLELTLSSSIAEWGDGGSFGETIEGPVVVTP